MGSIYFASSHKLSRRTLLRASGVALGLPLLDAMTPAFSAEPATTPPRRMFVICTNMGILPMYFFPSTAGADYELTPYLKILEAHRRQLTVFSGVSHPDVDGGHMNDNSFLTAAPHPGRGGFRNSISLDQFCAEKIGHQTRFPALNIDIGVEHKHSLSWTGGGVMIPGDYRPSRLYSRLFLNGTPAEVEAQVAQLREGRSVLDAVSDRARTLQSRVGGLDRAKLDQYFTSLRELERRLHLAEAWERRPKPRVEAPPPRDIDDATELIGRTRVMFQLARLALETDSTRLITLLIDQVNTPKPNIPGVTAITHSLTHQSGSEAKRNELRLIEEAQFRIFNELLTELTQSREQGAPLLDRTMVLYGTIMGNAGLHTNTNVPVLLAGGGFRHGQHLAFDQRNNVPLANLFVSMLQRLGLEVDRFASSTGTMRGLTAV